MLSEGVYNDYHGEDQFIIGLKALNSIVDALSVQNVSGAGKDAYARAAGLAGANCIPDNDDYKTHEAFILLKKIVEQGIKYIDTDYLLVALTLIIQCQKVYLSLERETEGQ